MADRYREEAGITGITGVTLISGANMGNGSHAILTGA